MSRKSRYIKNTSMVVASAGAIMVLIGISELPTAAPVVSGNYIPVNTTALTENISETSGFKLTIAGAIVFVVPILVCLLYDLVCFEEVYKLRPMPKPRQRQRRFAIHNYKPELEPQIVAAEPPPVTALKEKTQISILKKVKIADSPVMQVHRIDEASQIDWLRKSWTKSAINPTSYHAEQETEAVGSGKGESISR